MWSWFVGTVVGTALGGLLPNPEIFGLDFALVGMFIGILLLNSRLCKDGFPVRNLLIILAVVAVSFSFTLDSGISVTSCSVCDATWLYNGGGF